MKNKYRKMKRENKKQKMNTENEKRKTNQLHHAQDYCSVYEKFRYGKCSKSSNTNLLLLFPLLVFLRITFQQNASVRNFRMWPYHEKKTVYMHVKMW